MTDLEEQALSLIEQTLKLTHSTLSKHPSASSEARDLSSAQHLILQSLDQNSFTYQSLVTALAIDSYAVQITRQGSMLQEVSALLTIIFQKMSKLEEGINQKGRSVDLSQIFREAKDVLIKLIRIHQEICPKSNFITQQNDLLKNNTKSNTKKQANEGEVIEKRLREENEELRKQLNLNDEKLLAMEFKLTKLLKEGQNKFDRYNQDTASINTLNQSRHNMMNYLELKEQLAYKQAEIERMNEEFSYEIEKYNTVYDAMKRELEELKAYQNIDLIEQIELLETEIVRLREERERDQLIIKQLRSDSMMMSGASHLSPRNNARFQNSRYNY